MTTPHLATRGLALVLCLIPSLAFARAGDANRDGAVTVTDGVQLLQMERGAAATRALRRALAPVHRGKAGHRARGRAARAITTVEVRLTFTATTTLQGYQIEVGYPVAKGDFQGSGGSVACVSNGGGGFFFANDDDAGKLIMNQGSAVDLTFPFDVICRFDQNDGSTLAPADLTITTVEVVHEGAPGDPATLQVAVAVGPVTVPCDSGTLTLTTQPGGVLDLGTSGLAHGSQLPSGTPIEAQLDCSGPSPCQTLGTAPAGSSTGPPLPVSAGGVPICIVSTVSEPLVGTFDCGSQCSTFTAALASRVFLNEDVGAPCPHCVGDVTANDGLRGGTCDGGATPGAACDVNGETPFFGTTSNDCLPSGSSVGEASLTPTFTTGTQTLAASLDCRDSRFPTGACHCPDQVNANPCNDAVCGASGVCENGPLEGRCSVQTFRPCVPGTGTEACEDVFPGAGTCTEQPERCFPSEITRTGTCGEDGVLVATFCAPATRAAAINNVYGLPGPVALSLPVHVARALATTCSPTPRSGCLGADAGHRPTLLIANSPDRRDELAWRFPGGTATSGSPFGNPQVDTDYAFCAYSATPAGYEQLLQFAAPAGPRWRKVGDGFVYRDEASDSIGPDRIELSTGTKGPARIVVKAEGKDLPLPTLPLAPPLIVQLQSEGTCWEATYEASDLNQNDATRVRAPGS